MMEEETEMNNTSSGTTIYHFISGEDEGRIYEGQEIRDKKGLYGV